MTRLIKACVALVLIGWLIYRMDWNEALPTAARIPLWALGITFVAMVLELVTVTLRWSVALRMHMLFFPLGYLLRTVSTGFFFNNFLPSGFGGDLYRIYRTLPQEGYRSRSISAVLVDRLSGFGLLLALGALAALFLRTQYPIAHTYVVAFFLVFIAGLTGLWLLHSRGLAMLPARIRRAPAIDALQHNWQQLLRAGSLWAPLLLWSLIFQLLSVFIIYWLFLATGQPQPILHCMLIAAAFGTAALLPISINGIGVMEGSVVAMAVLLGADYDAAVVVALVRRALMFVLSLGCGLGYLLEGPKIEWRSAWKGQEGAG